MANSYLLVSKDSTWLTQKTGEIIQPPQSEGLFGDTISTTLDWEKLIQNPDTLILADKKSIGIEDVREITTRLSRKPFQEQWATIIITQADLLTIPAQNAFLKLLEEPPEYAKLVLWTPSLDQLLPTIISRCFVIKDALQVSIGDTSIIDISELSHASIGERLTMVGSTIKDRAQADLLITSILIYYRDKLQSQSSEKQAKTMAFLHDTISKQSLLAKQVSPKMVCDIIVMNLP